MNEPETRAGPIDPTLKAPGWCLVEGSKQPFASKYRTVLPTRFPFPSTPHPLASRKIMGRLSTT
jgi:hypothetical protein